MDGIDTKLAIERMQLPDAQKANALELLSVAEGVPPAQKISFNDFDGSLSLHWKKYEVAVYADRFETYHIWDGNTRIEHWPLEANAPLHMALVEQVRQAAK